MSLIFSFVVIKGNELRYIYPKAANGFTSPTFCFWTPSISAFTKYGVLSNDVVCIEVPTLPV